MSVFLFIFYERRMGEGGALGSGVTNDLLKKRRTRETAALERGGGQGPGPLRSPPKQPNRYRKACLNSQTALETLV